MSNAEQTSARPVPAYAWIILVALGALLELSALYILVAGVDPGEFEASTGLSWDTLEGTYPEVATYIKRLERLSGVALLGLASLGGALALWRFRRGDPWAWYALWVFPLVLGGIALVMLSHGAAGLGIYYGLLGLVALLALVLPYRAFFLR